MADVTDVAVIGSGPNGLPAPPLPHPAGGPSRRRRVRARASGPESPDDPGGLGVAGPPTGQQNSATAANGAGPSVAGRAGRPHADALAQTGEKGRGPGPPR